MLEDVLTYEKDFNKLVLVEHRMYPILKRRIEEVIAKGIEFNPLAYEIPPIPPLKDEKKRYSL